MGKMKEQSLRLETQRNPAAMTVPLAIASLREALVAAEYQPVDTPTLRNALAHLEGLMKDPQPVRQVRMALTMTNATRRWKELHDAVAAIEHAWANRPRSGSNARGK